MMTSRNTAAGRHSARPLPVRDDVALEHAAGQQRGLADQIAGAELRDGRAVAQHEEPPGEHDVEPVGALAAAEQDRAGVDLEELELRGQLDALRVVERAKQRAGPHPAIDQPVAHEAQHRAQDVAVVREHARQRVAIDAQELGGLRAHDGRRARLIGHQRDLADERAGPEPRHVDVRRALGLDRDLALDDHVQRVARIALAKQQLPAIERDELEVRDQRLERVARQPGEQRRRGERAGGGRADHARLRQRDLLEIGRGRARSTLELARAVDSTLMRRYGSTDRDADVGSVVSIEVPLRRSGSRGRRVAALALVRGRDLGLEVDAVERGAERQRDRLALGARDREVRRRRVPGSAVAVGLLARTREAVVDPLRRVGARAGRGGSPRRPGSRAARGCSRPCSPARVWPAPICSFICGEPAKRVGVLRVDLQDHLADRDRLHEEAVLRVALRGALERVDRVRVVAEPAIGLAGALGPLRVARLERARARGTPRARACASPRRWPGRLLA